MKISFLSLLEQLFELCSCHWLGHNVCNMAAFRGAIARAHGAITQQQLQI